jgi:hypothetical protein
MRQCFNWIDRSNNELLGGSRGTETRNRLCNRTTKPRGGSNACQDKDNDNHSTTHRLVYCSLHREEQYRFLEGPNDTGHN